MKIPVSWLKDFIEIKIPFPELARKLSSVGLTIETWENEGSDVVFDPEVTPNRPDWMSVYGVAREVAAVTNTKIRSIKPVDIVGKKKTTELVIKNDFDLCPRYTALVVRWVKVKPSPDWMQKRLKLVGLRPINNLVDISNYIMWELGNPIHIFDYDKIRGHQMTLEEAKGGEAFRSLDGLDYKLPKGAIIIKDLGRIIDLCGIKGGENTAVSTETKNILIHVPIYNPVNIRRASQSLGLRSDASTIFERGSDPGGTIRTLNRTTELTIELAGGETSSQIIDLKKSEFLPWKVSMRHERLEKVLGVEIKPERVKDFLDRLELSAQYADHKYEVTVPTFRNDIHIEEDLIEEVGRIYGYDNFPKTLPTGSVPTTPVAYAKDYDFEYRIKSILKGAGYAEIYTYSLISEKQLLDLGINPEKVLRVDNPISRDYEYLRPFILGNLLEAFKLNQANFSDIKIFELGKAYKGETLDRVSEPIFVSALLSGEKFSEAKGTAELLLSEFGIQAEYTTEGIKEIPGSHPGRSAMIKSGENIGFVGEINPALLSRFGIKNHVAGFFLNENALEKLLVRSRKYQSIPKYPAVVEDISLILSGKTLVGDVMETIRKTSSLVNQVELIDIHGETKTFRITFLDRAKNLTDQEVAKVREKIQTNWRKENPKGR